MGMSFVPSLPISDGKESGSSKLNMHVPTLHAPYPLHTHTSEETAHDLAHSSMKTALVLLALPLHAGAFFLVPTAPSPSRVVMQASLRGGNNDMASRQEHLGGAFRALGLAALGSAAVLGANGGMANAAAKIEYLKEPTPEFVELQKRALEFEKVAYEKKKVWQGLYAALPAAKTEPELVKALDALTKFVLEEKGLPIGLKKQALVSDIRTVKRSGKENKIWNKDAEISYEQLIYSVNYETSPNTSRDLQNPL